MRYLEKRVDVYLIKVYTYIKIKKGVVRNDEDQNEQTRNDG